MCVECSTFLHDSVVTTSEWLMFEYVVEKKMVLCQMCDVYTNAWFEWFLLLLLLLLSFFSCRVQIRVDSFSVTNRNLVIRFNVNDTHAYHLPINNNFSSAVKTFVHVKNVFCFFCFHMWAARFFRDFSTGCQLYSRLTFDQFHKNAVKKE